MFWGMTVLAPSQAIREHVVLYFAVIEDYSSCFPWLPCCLFSQICTPYVSFSALKMWKKNCIIFATSCEPGVGPPGTLLHAASTTTTTCDGGETVSVNKSLSVRRTNWHEAEKFKARGTFSNYSKAENCGFHACANSTHRVRGLWLGSSVHYSH